MKRAAVIIGVDKTGTLPKLRDAVRGAERMAEWARAQGMDSVELLTDATGPLDVSRIKTTIRTLVEASNIGQLIVYFAGHGVNRQRQEYWLLSDAPGDTGAAVNVAGSAALAATCGIPHVVFISDACRTAAEGILAGSVTGNEIFPNREGSATPVDQFFACELGRPSNEVKDPNVTTAEFRALYTDELVPALRGERAEILEWTTSAGVTVGHVHPRPLRDYLSSAVALRLTGLHLHTEVIQVPTAIISSDPPAWLSQVNDSGAKRGLGFGPDTPTPPGRGGRGPRRKTTTNAAKAPPPPNLADNIGAVQAGLASGAASPGTEGVVDSAIRLARPFGPTHHETECGFKIRGARIVSVHTNSVQTDLHPNGDDVRVYAQGRASVLLVLDSGAGALLPAIRGFITALTVDEGELVDVAYEPSDNTMRWGEYQHRAAELRALRSIAASSLTRGVFRLERDDALDIARRMQYSKGIDPSLAIYAAYAYHDLQRTDLIKQMSGYLAGDLGAPFFDLALLSRALDGRTVSDNAGVISPIPLLAQGWAFLNAYRVSIPPGLQGLDKRLTSSLWTLLDAQGVEQVRSALASGNIK